MERIWSDLRYALRALAQSPQFTVSAVLGLGLGLAVSSLMFSAVNAYVFRPLPVRDGGDLVALAVMKPTAKAVRNLSYPNLVDIRDDLRSFDDVFAYSPFTSSVRVAHLSERLTGEVVTGNYFQALRVRPHAGRLLRGDDDRPAAEPVVVISHAFWRNRLASDSSIVGGTVRLNGSLFAVVGVAEEGYHGIDSLLRSDMWVPAAHAARAGGGGVENRDGNSFRVRGYLRSGVSLRQSQAEVDTLAARLRERYPVENTGLQISVVPERRTRPLIDARDLVPVAGSVLIGLGLIVLVNTCGSVMGLMLARSVERQREVSLRLALGASGRQVLWQTVLESGLVALGGGLVAWLGVKGAADLISAAVPPGSMYRFDVQPDVTVLAFTFLTAVTAGVAIGVVPALAAIRTDIRTILAGGHSATTDRKRTRMRARVVMVQFAIVTALLVTASLVTSSANVAKETVVGFPTANRLLVRVAPGDNGYGEPRGRQILEEVLRRAASLPGVRSATTVHDVPLGPSSASFEVRAQDDPTDASPRRVSYNIVGPDYFETVGIPLVRGQTFDARNTRGGDVAIVNQRLAASYWPRQDPIGKHLIAVREGDDPRVFEVIGVAQDTKYNSIGEAPRGYIYLPFAQHYRSEMTLVLHTVSDPAPVTDAVRTIIPQVDPALATDDITTLEASIDTNALGSVRFGAGLLGVFGLLGTALALFGMFGLLSYTTQLQKRDIGIRMALGATHGAVTRYLLERGARLAGKGVAVGLVVSLVVTTLLRSSIFGMGSLDPVPFVIIPALLAGVALIAGYIPARRILAGNPMRSLGHE